MGNVFLVPSWFFGYDVVLELIFAIITLSVGIYAFKIYNLSGQRQTKLFGGGFLFISASYFVQSILNFAIVSKLNENVCQALKISDVAVLNAVGIYAYIFLFIAGLVTLVYMTFRIKNWKIYSLLLLVSLLAITLIPNTLYFFYLLASVFLFYICTHYFSNYIKNKNPQKLLVLIAFGFLLFSTFHFIFSVNHSLYYAVGHILELIAYILILINLIRVIKK